MDYNKNCDEQYKKIKLSNTNLKRLDENKQKCVYDIFKALYLLNLLKNSVELKTDCNNIYFKNAFSCLIESFILMIDNQIRAAYLVLRSSIESFMKFIILKLRETVENFNYKIDDRSFSKNKNTIDHIITNNDYLNIFGTSSLILTLKNKYGCFSSLSHSSTDLIENFNPEYLLNAKNISDSSLMLFYKHFLETIIVYIKLFIPIFISSFKEWDSSSLTCKLELILSRNQASKLIKKINKYNNLYNI